MGTRAFFAAVLCAVALAQTAPSDAQDYPAKPIQLIVPFPPGSSIEMMARGFAQALDGRLNQRVVVLNRGGGAMTIGMSAMVQAAPDGYTLLYSPATPLVVQPYRMKSLPYAREAVAPLCQTFENLYLVATAPKSALSTIRDVFDQAKRNPGKLRYNTTGVGSAPHLAGAELWIKAGVQLVDVPYGSEVVALPHLLAGDLDLGVITLGVVLVHKLKPLAVFATERVKQFPDVPTTRELGYAIIPSGYGGLFVRTDTPAPIVARLEAACREATADPAYRGLAEKQFLSPAYLDRAQFSERLEADYRGKGKLLPSLKLPE